MKKILVLTDFSQNAEAAIRFAIQLASQSNFALTFFYVCQIMRPTQWKETIYASFEKDELRSYKNRLQKYVTAVYERSGIPTPEKIEIEVQNGINTETNILEFSSKNKYDYLCISRHGHGNSLSLFGSITSHLITKSEIPVIVIPSNYQVSQIDSITYVSDLTNVEKELKLTMEFSESIGAEVELLHFTSAEDDLRHLNTLNVPIKVHYEPLKYEKTLIENMEDVFKHGKTSMLIMFTKHKRTFFEKLFISSISAEYASTSNIPLLVFKKP